LEIAAEVLTEKVILRVSIRDIDYSKTNKLAGDALDGDG
jgi:hypothetical protein